MFAAKLAELRASRASSSAQACDDGGCSAQLPRAAGSPPSDAARGCKRTHSEASSDIGPAGLGDDLPDVSGDELSEGEDVVQPSFAMRRLLKQPSKPQAELPAGFKHTSWWAQSMRNAVAERWDSMDEAFGISRCPIKLDSFCSGFATEVIAARVLGIPLDGEITASEPLECCQEFMITNLGEDIKHVVRSIGAQASDVSYCVKHSCECATSKGRSRSTDILIGGTPCQPFTAMRRNQCRRHPLYNVTFGDSDMADPTNSLMHLIESTLPGALILEQVANFGSFDDSLQERPAERLITKLLCVKGADGKAHFKAVRAFEINSNLWVQLERPRFQICK
jgi:hypothetical protein